MSGFVYQPAHHTNAWQRYLASEHAARDAYLSTTHHAHLEYLTGPWPDREAYNHVELSAWVTYYAAGRAAWQAYTTETAAGTPEVYRRPTDAVTALWEALEAVHGQLCPECGVKWRNPSPDCPKRTYDVHPRPEPHLTRDAGSEVWPADPTTHAQPTFTERPERI